MEKAFQAIKSYRPAALPRSPLTHVPMSPSATSMWFLNTKKISKSCSFQSWSLAVPAVWMFGAGLFPPFGSQFYHPLLCSCAVSSLTEPIPQGRDQPHDLPTLRDQRMNPEPFRWSSRLELICAAPQITAFTHTGSLHLNACPLSERGIVIKISLRDELPIFRELFMNLLPFKRYLAVGKLVIVHFHLKFRAWYVKLCLWGGCMVLSFSTCLKAT